MIASIALETKLYARVGQSPGAAHDWSRDEASLQMRRLKQLLLVGAVFPVFALTGCGSEATVSGDAARCEGIPVASQPPVEVDVFSGTTLVASTTTSASGTYRMTLGAGTYTIRVPANPSRVVYVTLQPGGSAEADFPNICK